MGYPHLKIVNMAKSVIWWIKRSLISKNRLVMINVYKTLVRPHIEYAVQLWNLPAVHGNWNNIMELEDVQRSFTRLVEGIGLLPYKDRLKELQLTTLLERRVANYWNKIPGYIKEANTVTTFKLQLQKFKDVCISSGRPSSGQFWELSETLLSTISGSNHNLYVDFNDC